VGVEPTSGDHHSGRIWMFRLVFLFRTGNLQTAPDARRTCTKPTSTLQDSNLPLPHQSRGVLTTNTKGVVGCLKNLAVETNRIAFRAWHCLSAQVGFEPTATARKIARLPPYVSVFAMSLSVKG